MIPIGKRIMQNAYVVNDVEEAAWRWVKATGVGPFLVNKHLKLSSINYRGQPAQLDFSIAIAQAGEVQIELIEQHCANPSCYRDLFPAGREGFHHVCVIAGDYDAEVQSYIDKGFDMRAHGTLGDLRFCYLDTSAVMGHMLEIVEDKPSIHAFFGAVRAAGEAWDGVTDPVRPLGG
jgi:hypothetical protein